MGGPGKLFYHRVGLDVENVSFFVIKKNLLIIDFAILWSLRGIDDHKHSKSTTAGLDTAAAMTSDMNTY